MILGIFAGYLLFVQSASSLSIRQPDSSVCGQILVAVSGGWERARPKSVWKDVGHRLLRLGRPEPSQLFIYDPHQLKVVPIELSLKEKIKALLKRGDGTFWMAGHEYDWKNAIKAEQIDEQTNQVLAELRALWIYARGAFKRPQNNSEHERYSDADVFLSDIREFTPEQFALLRDFLSDEMFKRLLYDLRKRALTVNDILVDSWLETRDAILKDKIERVIEALEPFNPVVGMSLTTYAILPPSYRSYREMSLTLRSIELKSIRGDSEEAILENAVRDLRRGLRFGSNRADLLNSLNQEHRLIPIFASEVRDFIKASFERLQSDLDAAAERSEGAPRATDLRNRANVISAFSREIERTAQQFDIELARHSRWEQRKLFQEVIRNFLQESANSDRVQLNRDSLILNP